MLNFSSALLLFLLSLLGEGAIAQAPALQFRSGFSEDMLDRYTAAVSAIEGKREEILRRAKNSPTWQNVVQTAEAQNKDICRLSPPQQPADIQALCQELMEFSEKAIRRHGLTNREFNQITLTLQRDKQLQNLIHSRLLRRRQP